MSGQIGGLKTLIRHEYPKCIYSSFCKAFFPNISAFSTFTSLKVNSHWKRHDPLRHDADQIWFVGISAMRTHRVFSWMRHDASKMKKSIFDATLCFRTIGKVSEIG